MKGLRTLVAIIAVLWGSISASAKVEINGIWYYLESSTKQAMVTYKGDYNTDYEEYIRSITIPATVTYDGVNYSVESIGAFAFSYCSSLTSITLPESVTSIESRAFQGCSSLTSINIPASVTNIGNNPFAECSSLTSIIVAEGNAIYDSRENCNAIIETKGNSLIVGCSATVIPNSVTRIENYAFERCISLTAINIPASVTSIGIHAFEECSSLASINIPASVTFIGNRAFFKCSSLTSIIVAEDNAIYDSRENCNAIIKTKNNYLIVGCSATVIPNSVTSIGDYAFYYCSSLTSITIPENSQLTSIGDYAFSGCSSLTSITIPESVTSIGDYAFSGCSSLTSITIPEGVTSIRSSAFSRCSSLTSITIPENSQLTSIGDYAFSGCSSLTSITIPEGVTSIGDDAFEHCSSLKTINIPNSVTSIGGNAFLGTAWYNNQPDGVMYIGNMLYSYKGTMPANTSINVKEGTIRIIGSAFYGCSSLTSITIPEGVTSIGVFAFSDCSSLTSITIPSSVTSIGECAFSWCGRLKSIIVSEGNMIYDSRNGCNAIIETNYNALIQGCSTTVIPEGVTSIGVSAFLGCKGLTSIIIPEGVTRIGEIAFHGCDSLTSIVIPESVKRIDSSAFLSCSSLASIFVKKTDILNLNTDFGGVFAGVNKNSCTLYVPSVAQAKYASASGWSDFANIVPYYHKLTYRVGNNVIDSQWKTAGDLITTPKYENIEGYTFNQLGGVFSRPIDIASNADRMLYSNAPCTNTTYGDQFIGWHVLFDGNANTFFHSEYSDDVDSADGLDHYLRVDMGEGNSLIDFSFSYTVRGSDAWYTPTIIVVEGSNDADGEYTEIAKLTDLPRERAAVYKSGILGNGKAYQYIRFRVIKTVGNDKVSGHPYFYFAEFGMEELQRVDMEDVSQMPACDLIIEGTLTTNTYKVFYYVEDEFVYTDEVAFGEVIPEYVYEPIDECFEFVEWIWPNDVYWIMPARDVRVDGVLVRNKYHLIFSLDGEEIKSQILACGASIVVPELPEREGYTFSGWENLPETMPAHDVTVKGYFVKNKYHVTFTIGGGVLKSELLEYGAPIVLPSMPEREGYTFSGWDGVNETVPAHDVTYDATYIVNKYMVYYFVGTKLVHSVEVAYDEEIPDYVYEPRNENEVFMGWKGDVYDTMPAHDVTYTAKIEKVDAGIEKATYNSLQTTVIYDLQGRRVLNTENLKGVYIVNGKKVVMK